MNFTLGVCNVLKKTIDLNFSDFDNVLLQDMNQFLETVLIPSNNAGLAHKIQKSLMKNMQAVYIFTIYLFSYN